MTRNKMIEITPESIASKKDLLSYIAFKHAITPRSLASKIDGLICMYAENGHNKSADGYKEEALEEVWEDLRNYIKIPIHISDEEAMDAIDGFCKPEYGFT